MWLGTDFDRVTGLAEVVYNMSGVLLVSCFNHHLQPGCARGQIEAKSVVPNLKNVGAVGRTDAADSMELSRSVAHPDVQGENLPVSNKLAH